MFEVLTVKHSVGAFLPIALGFIALEYGYARLADHDKPDKQYDVAETSASIGVALGHLAARILTGGLAALPLVFLYQNRIFDIPINLWSVILLYFCVEFAYYWFHLASHKTRWFWATHSVHHSATKFNLSAAIRLGWTGEMSGAFIFFLPLAWIGFHPMAILLILAAGLIYQFFLHTHLDVDLGPFEWVFNTPKHHRVHHASNDSCLDKNYGSTLIIFDRLFGTFATAPQDQPLKFGLKGRDASNNPLKIAFDEWGFLLRDVRNAKGVLGKLRVLFSPP